jgi:hypothetical protein
MNVILKSKYRGSLLNEPSTAEGWTWYWGECKLGSLDSPPMLPNWIAATTVVCKVAGDMGSHEASRERDFYERYHYSCYEQLFNVE